MCLVSHANNKGAAQPAHPRSPISAFVVRCFDSIISLRFYSQKFKTLASFRGCAGQFVSGMVGNSRRYVLSCRGSYILYILHVIEPEQKEIKEVVFFKCNVQLFHRNTPDSLQTCERIYIGACENSFRKKKTEKKKKKKTRKLYICNT